MKPRRKRLDVRTKKIAQIKETIIDLDDIKQDIEARLWHLEFAHYKLAMNAREEAEEAAPKPVNTFGPVKAPIADAMFYAILEGGEHNRRELLDAVY